MTILASTDQLKYRDLKNMHIILFSAQQKAQFDWSKQLINGQS